MNDWDEVVAYAATLPFVEVLPFCGTPCPKINGKTIIAPGRESGTSFCLLATQQEKQLLLDTDPDTFWITDHYATYPAVLVRYGTASRDRIELYIRRAWWDRLKKGQRAAVGMERP